MIEDGATTIDVGAKGVAGAGEEAVGGEQDSTGARIAVFAWSPHGAG